jgi:1,4-dihydroxy-2-naphthoate octaprenyltransferase
MSHATGRIGVTGSWIEEGHDMTSQQGTTRGRRLPAALTLAALVTLVVAFVMAGPGVVGLIALAALWIATTAAHLAESTPPPDALETTNPMTSTHTQRRR